MRIEVTADHIARGVRRDRYACPIALALSERTGHRWAVGGIAADRDADRYYALPRRAVSFAIAFDQGEPVQPFSFSLGGAR